MSTAQQAIVGSVLYNIKRVHLWTVSNLQFINPCNLCTKPSKSTNQFQHINENRRSRRKLRCEVKSASSAEYDHDVLSLRHSDKCFLVEHNVCQKVGAANKMFFPEWTLKAGNTGFCVVNCFLLCLCAQLPHPRAKLPHPPLGVQNSLFLLINEVTSISPFGRLSLSGRCRFCNTAL